VAGVEEHDHAGDIRGGRRGRADEGRCGDEQTGGYRGGDTQAGRHGRHRSVPGD
jgi:hypothetical protein